MAKKKGKRSRRLPPKKAPVKKKKISKQVMKLATFLSRKAETDPEWMAALKDLLDDRRKTAKKKVNS